MYSTASSPDKIKKNRRGGKGGMSSPAAPKKYSKLHRFWRENREGWMFVLPLVIGLGLFTAYPMVQSLIWSFFNYTGIRYYYPVGLIILFRSLQKISIFGRFSATLVFTLSSAFP